MVTGAANRCAAVCTAVHAEGPKEDASKLSLSSIRILKDDGHEAQDPSTTEVTVCCWTLVPRQLQMEDTAL